MDRINDGVFEHTAGQDPHWYSGWGTDPNSGYLQYDWASPQRVTNIVAAVGQAGVQSSYGGFEPWTLQYSTVGSSGPWVDLHGPDSTATQEVLHLAVDLENVRSLRLYSDHERGQYQRFQEFAVYGGSKAPTATLPPASDPALDLSHSISNGLTSFNPGELIRFDAPHEWARESGLASGNGRSIEWRGYWPGGTELGGILLWGGAASGVNYYYPSVNTFDLYVLKGGADIDSMASGDWELLSSSTSALLKDGAALEILFPQNSIATEGVRLVQTGDAAQYNFSLYGGHMVLLTGQVPEPATALLVGMCTTAMLIRRRRR